MAKAKKGSKLIIVESPHKASVIQKFLGPEFKAVASAGHIRDLPKGSSKNRLGIDVTNGFVMNYIVIKSKEKKVEELKKALLSADEVYLAPDPDREGEAIAWHLKEALGIKESMAKRITYQSVTKKSVLEALEHPRPINMNLVNAQQARRALDRLVGFSLSPFLWKKVAKNLSAGRVQSPAVRMVVLKEQEIKAFVSEEYWSLDALFITDHDHHTFTATLHSYQGKRYQLGHPSAANKEAMDRLLEDLKQSSYQLTEVETKESKSKAAAPFITSTLQQAANTYLRFGTKKTMVLAQKLYEGVEINGSATGLITYMRTDSTYIDAAAQAEARDYIIAQYGPNYVPEKNNIYSSKNSQEAHEAIRPAVISITPLQVKAAVSNDEYRLYDLIWRRFMQSQMTSAIYANTTAKITAGEAIFEAKGRLMLFDGFHKLSKEKSYDDPEENILPPLKSMEPINLDHLNPLQHYTKAPARYNEASLVRALEKEGIGRPSTYAPIIQTIMERGYAIQKERVLYATELGIAVNSMLEKNFSDIVNYQFTADMESRLDKVETGEKNWIELLRDFYLPFDNHVNEAMADAEPLKGRPWPGEERCPLCNKELVVKYSKAGAFLGCSNYPECKGLLPMVGESGDEDEEFAGFEAIDCPGCGKPMSIKKSRFGKIFYACSDYPNCKTTLSVDKDGKPMILPKTDELCNKCGKPMVVKMSRRGSFLACSGYPDCKNALGLTKDGAIEFPPVIENMDPCDKCGSDMVVKKGPRGWFLACSSYPKCRNARAIDDKSGGSKDSLENKDSTKKSTIKKVGIK